MSLRKLSLTFNNNPEDWNEESEVDIIPLIYEANVSRFLFEFLSQNSIVDNLKLSRIDAD